MKINKRYKFKFEPPTIVGQLFACPFGSGEEYKVKSFPSGGGFLATSVTAPHQIFRFKLADFVAK